MAGRLGGGGGSFSKTSGKAAPKIVLAKKAGPKKLSHKELAGKWAAQGGKFADQGQKVWSKSDIDRARGEAMARDARSPKQVHEDRGLAAEVEPATIFTKGQKNHEAARTRMADLAQQLQNLAIGHARAGDDDSVSAEQLSEEELEVILDCRQLQQEEIETLEAMYVDEFRLSADLDELRAMLEEAAHGEVALRGAVARGPPLEFTLQLTVPDEDQSLVASLLLKVRFPPLYPSAGHPPELNVEDAMVTHADAELKEDAVLSTLALVDEGALVGAMLQQAAETQPDPCVFEMATWVSENAFSFISLLPEFRQQA